MIFYHTMIFLGINIRSISISCIGLYWWRALYCICMKVFIWEYWVVTHILINRLNMSENGWKYEDVDYEDNFSITYEVFLLMQYMSTGSSISCFVSFPFLFVVVLCSGIWDEPGHDDDQDGNNVLRLGKKNVCTYSSFMTCLNSTLDSA